MENIKVKTKSAYLVLFDMQILGVGSIFVYRAQHFRSVILEKVKELVPEMFVLFILF